MTRGPNRVNKKRVPPTWRGAEMRYFRYLLCSGLNEKIEMNDLIVTFRRGIDTYLGKTGRNRHGARAEDRNSWLVQTSNTCRVCYMVFAASRFWWRHFGTVWSDIYCILGTINELPKNNIAINKLN